ncbi:germinal-center associated nuclear protein-like [Perognathus longimembris pacificus]|uniref:germinal-center associated nuclear protein-like n=1 Tax=Perognathus longimembris pacificus TaxID=214514 RepID=UPI0020187405|nr:germinal-center associated nuclear protein-like [Perognathus longimembris pacificus]XP_048223618.1 germinal-center associated nuclear protein-like [Perognathus longimembris pacificus]XP_048223648.1 germinal-center associated nuclear protein-like [Perognathus longimembris pacificus]
MNPGNPSGGQQPGAFAASPRSTGGTLQAKLPFGFRQPLSLGQSSTLSGKNPVLSQVPSFGAPSGISCASKEPAFGPTQTSSAGLFSGVEHTAFGATSGPSSSPVSGNPGFKLPSSTSSGVFPSTSTLGPEAGETVSSGSRKTKFSFKIPEDSVFRPVLGAESEPEDTQSQVPSGFFSLPRLLGSGPGSPMPPLSSPQVTSNSATDSNFIFSNPANTNSSSAFAPALLNQTVEEKKRGPGPVFGGASSSFSFVISSGSLGEPFPASKTSAKQGCEEAVSPVEPLPNLVKGLKRKKSQDRRSPGRHGQEVVGDSDPLSRGDHPPGKRPARLNRPPGGALFGRKTKEVFESNKAAGHLLHKESKGQSSFLPSGESEASPGSQSVLNPSGLPGVNREQETERRERKASVRGTPVRQNKRRQSTDSLGGFSPLETKAIECKNIPDHLNDRAFLDNYFRKVAKVQRIDTWPSRKLAVVHFFDHPSAALARKKGKRLHKEVSIFWHKKIMSPNKKRISPKEKKPGDGAAGQGLRDASFPQSPLDKRLGRVAPGSPLKASSPVKKPRLLEAHGGEGHPFDAGSEGSGGLGLCMSPLSGLIGTMAETSEAKYRVLAERDRILRRAGEERKDLGPAGTVVGTCPDMCPEKERYQREARGQLSVFEVIPGTRRVDHAAAVKEYSRSSAGQEEPLAHELRPPAVLSHTMDYLVTQILDRKDSSLRDWYDFVWNRTRGLRKDIMQQQLCDPAALSVLERCARFHIHCAHFLCEEPPSTFDAALNAENLSQCLRSLREMYGELGRRGVPCPGEAEFQAYHVLLHLDRGDVLGEVQRLRPELRESPEVNLAMQAAMALSSHNFVRFFKLARAAPYLSACLLHRHFDLVRRRALAALNVAYTASVRRPARFPLDDVARMLLFADTREAADFLCTHGLTVSEGHVELTRARSQVPEPEGRLQAQKSVFVTRKLTVSVGEVVNGAPLSPAPCLTPANSFGSHHEYLGASLAEELPSGAQRPRTEGAGGAGDAARAAGPRAALPGLSPPPPAGPVLSLAPFPRAPIPAAAPSFPQQSIQLQPRLPRAVPADSEEAQPGLPPPPPARPVLSLAPLPRAPIPAAAPNLPQPSIQLQPRPPRAASADSEAALAAVAEELLSEAVRGGCEAVGTAGAAFAAAALAVSDAALDDLLAELTGLEVAECAREACAEEAARSQEAESEARMARCTEDICGCLLGTVLAEEIAQTAGEALREGRRSRRFLQRWRAATVAAQRSRRGPTAPSPPQLLGRAAWAPLDLPRLLAQHVPGAHARVFWKLVLVLPRGEEHTPGSPSGILAEWLKVKFLGEGGGAGETQTRAIVLRSGRTAGRAVSVHVCVQVDPDAPRVGTLHALEAPNALLGTSGLVLLLPPNVKSEDGQGEDGLGLPARLQQLLRAKPCHPALPLVVLVPSSRRHGPGKEVEDGLMLQDLVSAKLVSEYMVVEIPDSIHDARATEQVTHVAQWLVSRCPHAPDLCCQTLTQYVEDGVSLAFSGRFFQDRKERRLAGLASQEPGAIVELFNSVLQFLASVASSEKLGQLSWPVPEFAEAGGRPWLPHLHWNAPEHLAWLKQAVLGFQLPQLALPPPGAPWLPMCSMVLQYASQIPSSRQTWPVLHSQVESLLRQTYLRWKSKSFSRSRQAGPSVAEVPWDDVLALCIDHKLRDWTPPLLPLTSQALSQDGQVCVYFFKNELKKFDVPLSWKQARAQTWKELQLTRPRVGIKSFCPSATHVPTPLLQLHQQGKRRTECGPKGRPGAEDLMLGAPAEELLIQRLSGSLLLEKEENERFEEQLQQWLSQDLGSWTDSTSLPLYLPQTLVSLPGTIESMAQASTVTRPRTARTREQLRPPEPLGTSLTERLKHLEKLIQSSRKEEVASELHLSALLDMVDI